ncbi:hypothetical protein SD457_07970 [Coprobacillaceae bacterium CR2/5/TPMF4]|nr:hypothetical protein SD457_07970 [Coprobacillaceae bacterium CR2/5/TPMF4]
MISFNLVVTSLLTLVTDSLKLAYSSLDLTETANSSNFDFTSLIFVQRFL